MDARAGVTLEVASFIRVIALFSEIDGLSQFARRLNGQAVDAMLFTSAEWETLKLSSDLGDFVMPCCKSAAALKTSINGNHFFAHISDECATAPETIWHRAGKAAVLAGLSSLGWHGTEEAPGSSPSGDKWEADVLFTVRERQIAIELQRSYQHLRDFRRRQERYAASGVDCFWLVRAETFRTLAKSAMQLRRKRDFGGAWPGPGILGTGMLPELPVAMLAGCQDEPPAVHFGSQKTASVPEWLDGIVNNKFQFRCGSWNLG
ncbi:competence protein CoiA [Roseateles asaccharophilus]|uniref:competence protein CoiA n=1 Tax=Roseateles asaccharophilus TaxID=582607 RepID=UPI003832C6AA